jgi:hypothetical protein
MWIILKLRVVYFLKSFLRKGSGLGHMSAVPFSSTHPNSAEIKRRSFNKISDYLIIELKWCPQNLWLRRCDSCDLGLARFCYTATSLLWTHDLHSPLFSKSFLAFHSPPSPPTQYSARLRKATMHINAWADSLDPESPDPLQVAEIYLHLFLQHEGVRSRRTKQFVIVDTRSLPLFTNHHISSSPLIRPNCPLRGSISGLPLPTSRAPSQGSYWSQSSSTNLQEQPPQGEIPPEGDYPPVLSDMQQTSNFGQDFSYWLPACCFALHSGIGMSKGQKQSSSLLKSSFGEFREHC